MVTISVGFHETNVFSMSGDIFESNSLLTHILNINLPDLLEMRGKLLLMEAHLINGTQCPENLSTDAEHILMIIFGLFSSLPVFPYSQWDAERELIQNSSEYEQGIYYLHSHVQLIDDFLRVKYVFTPLLDEYLNTGINFLTPKQIVQKLEEFFSTTQKSATEPYQTFVESEAKFFHTILGSEKKTLCKCYHFQSLGAFLYFDFFHGLEYNFIPKKCDNCGKYFLNKGGKYNNYCENPSPQDTEKTCRDVGAASRYQDKCKTDPVWQTYNRSYKTHYARYKKGKMTKDEFETWSGWAIEMRGKMERGEMAFEEYVELIKK